MEVLLFLHEHSHIASGATLGRKVRMRVTVHVRQTLRIDYEARYCKPGHLATCTVELQLG